MPVMTTQMTGILVRLNSGQQRSQVHHHRVKGNRIRN